MSEPIQIDSRRIRRRLVDLVRMPSLGGSEEAAVSRVAEWLVCTGAEVDLWSDPATELRGHPDYPGHEIERAWVPVVAARVRGRRPGPALLLTGHVDVVPPGDWNQWTLEPFSGAVEGDRLYGRGSSDMKSGLVAALEAFELFARGTRDFAGQIFFVAVPGEEDSGVGTLAAIRRGYRADAAIVTEPTATGEVPSIVIAHAGAMSVTLEVPGLAAHASRRHLGESALEHYFGIHEALRREEARLNASETNPLMRAFHSPYPTNVGVVQGGDWPSSVMDKLRVDLRVGVALGETVKEAEARLRRAVEEAVARDPWLAEHPPVLRVVSRGFGSAQVDPDHPLVAALGEAAEDVLEKAPPVTGAPYGCDMAGWVRLAGIPTVLYGPGDIELAHGPNEWVSLARTRRVARVLYETARRLLDEEEEPDLPLVQRGAPAAGEGGSR